MEPDAAAIRASVRERFGRLARDPASERKFPVGRGSARAMGYPEADLDALPASCVDRFAGVGDPLALGPVPRGGRVLDLGSGSGLDALRAARAAGPGGFVLGLDMTPPMAAAAAGAAREAGIGNAAFALGLAGALPLRDASVDLVLSNGVLNLCPDKEAVLAEVRRVLRPGGRLQAADIVLEDGVSPAEVARAGAWSD